MGIDAGIGSYSIYVGGPLNMSLPCRRSTRDKMLQYFDLLYNFTGVNALASR